MVAVSVIVIKPMLSNRFHYFIINVINYITLTIYTIGGVHMMLLLL